MLGPYCLPDFYTSYLKWIKDIYQCDLLLCERKLKVKIAHFWLPSMPQNRVCLSSCVSLQLAWISLRLA